MFSSADVQCCVLLTIPDHASMWEPVWELILGKVHTKNRLGVKQLTSKPPGRHPDGEGLYLLVSETGTRSWMLRVQVDGRRRDIGLGSLASIGLADARVKAEECRRLAKSGLDPVAERKKAPAAVMTFEAAAIECHTELKEGWRNKRHIDSWLTSLKTHIFPALGEKPITEITSLMVRDAIAPIWLGMPETSQRILQRIGVVLDYAHIKGWRPDGASLRSVPKGLPRQPVTDNHFAAMPYEDVPTYMQALAALPATVGRDALRFTILTAARSGETRLADWSEIDRSKAIWNIPAHRMKMKAAHVVPLSPAAMEIIERRWTAREQDGGLLFPSTLRRADGEQRPISDMTLTKVLRDDNIKSFTVHGFRSAFTDWAAEETNIAKEIVDKALAHKVADRVEAAYRRTDYFEKRRLLMAKWGAYLRGASASDS